jgi:glycosyltransferase involved in cell wall biosynthesis
MKKPLISIILSLFNNQDTLRACLDSLLTIDYPRYEVILVDDSSTDETLSIMREYEKKDNRIKVLTYSDNRGVPGARNEGMKVASGEIYVFSDGDCTFFKCWPSRLVKALEDPKVGASGGRDKSPPNEPLIKRCIDYTLTSFIGTGGIRGSHVRLSKYSFTGCNFAIKKSVVDKVGMHNEKIRYRGEEKEWAHRIREAGFQIKFVPNSFVLHYRRISLKNFWLQTYKSGKARVDILKHSPKAFELIHIVPSLFVLFLVIFGLLSFVNLVFFYIFLGTLFFYDAVLLIQSIIGAIRVKNILGLFIVPITTIIIHFAYGIGLIAKSVSGKANP